MPTLPVVQLQREPVVFLYVCPPSFSVCVAEALVPTPTPPGLAIGRRCGKSESLCLVHAAGPGGSGEASEGCSASLRVGSADSSVSVLGPCS